MAKFKTLQAKERVIDLTEFTDPATGEIIEVKDLSSSQNKFVIKEKQEMVTITSDDFVVIDVEVISVIAKMVNKADLAQVLKMSLTTTTQWNILTNTNNHFHSNESLQKYLEIKSESMFLKMIKRLMNVGVLYQMKGRIHGSVRVIYIMNPLLSRKRKTFDPGIQEIFGSFQKEMLKLKDK